MNLANEIIWMRLRLASWLVGKHTLVKNVEIGANGAGLYLTGDTKKHLENTTVTNMRYGLRMTGGQCRVSGFFNVFGGPTFEDHDHE